MEPGEGGLLMTRRKSCLCRVSSSNFETRSSKAATLRSSRFRRSARAAHRLEKKLDLSRFHKRDRIIHPTLQELHGHVLAVIVDPNPCVRHGFNALSTMAWASGVRAAPLAAAALPPAIAPTAP